MTENISPSTNTLFWVVGIRNYDLDNVEPIKWNKSKYEKELDKQRQKKKLNGTIKRTNLHELKSNITYDEIQQFSFTQLSKWVDALRNEIVDIWDTGSPPIIGKSKEGIIKSFRKLKDYPVENLLVEDCNYPNHIGIIKNFTKLGSPVNQFFPTNIYKMKFLSIEKFFLYFLNLFKKKYTGMTLINSYPEIIEIKKQMIDYTKKNLTTEKIANNMISDTIKYYAS